MTLQLPLFRRRKPASPKPGHDLFGQPISPSITADGDMLELAERLRALSEDAYHAGLERCCSLIEVTALMVEMEAGVGSAAREP
ncbi:hypothetical protein [Maricaulis sp.]|uniref:hypothetical protein n=1 Tax=Maricaulis sp. TaxID=1486257 RepID=UPI00262D82D7|nr:hypothetical protein [Maricaulis sp.]